MIAPHLFCKHFTKSCAFSYDAMLCNAATHLPRGVKLNEHVLSVVDDDILEGLSLRDNDGSHHVLRFNLHVMNRE